MSIRGIVRQQNKSFNSIIAMLINQKIQMYSFEKVLIGFNAAHCIHGRQGRGDMDGEQ
jgi:hypothetical protein